MHLAGGVADDEGGAVIGLGLGDGLDGLGGVGAHGDLGHVHIAVGHGDLGQGLLLHFLTGSGELGHLADVGSLGSLAAGVGVDLGVEDEDVDILAGSQDVVQAAEADVVGPAVAAEDPDGLLGEVLLVSQDLAAQLAGVALASGDNGVLQGGDELLGGLAVGLAVVHGVQPVLGGGLQIGVGPLHGQQGVGLVHQAVADGFLAQVHTEAMLGVVFKQGVGPGGAVAFLVGAVGRSSGGTAPDGGAAGGVGDIHPIAEELGHEAGIAGLGAAGAGAGELQQRGAELAALDGVILQLGLLGNLGHAVVEDILLGELLLLADHGQSLDRADAHADAAAHAVQRRDGHGEGVLALALAGLDGHDLGSGGDVLGLLLGEGEGPDGGMGADIGAGVALDALGLVPGGNHDGDAALLIGAGALLELAVHMVDEGGDGQAVAVHLAHGEENLLDLLHQLGLALQVVLHGDVLGVGPFGGHVDLDEGAGAGVNGFVVHIDHVGTLLHVGGGGLLLHVADGVLLGQNLGQGEEGGLQDGVGPLAHADGLRQVDGVDGVELNVVPGDVALGLGIQVVGQLLGGPLTVDHEHAAGLDVVDHLEALGDVGGVVAGDEVGLVDVVAAADGLVAEAQVGDGHAAGLLGVILEVGLDVLVGVVADDLDGVLVGADGAVAAETPELALDGAFRRGVGGGNLGQGEVGDVVHDADGELALGLGLGQLFIDGEDAGGRGVLGAEAVAAADDGQLLAGVGQGSDHIHVQRLAHGAGLLGPVEDGDLLAGGGDGGQELLGGEGAVQADLDQADLLAVGVHVVDDFLGHVADGAHGDDDALGVGGAIVVEQLIVGAQLLVDLAHVLLDHCGQGVVVLVAGLTVLEEDVAVLVAAAHVGPLGVEGMAAEGVDGVHVHHFLQILIVPSGDLLDLVGGAEAIKEVDEGNAALQGGQMGHGSQVHDFLDVALSQHGKAGLTAGHDVGVVAEDVQRMGGDGTGGDMEDAGEEFAGDLVHIGDHQQKTLRRRVGGGQGAGCQGAMDRAGGAGLGLHLADLDGGAEDVLPALGGPLIDVVGHGAGGGDGVNTRHFGKRIGDICCCVVTVHCNEFSGQVFDLLFEPQCRRAQRHQFIHLILAHSSTSVNEYPKKSFGLPPIPFRRRKKPAAESAAASPPPEDWLCVFPASIV